MDIKASTLEFTIQRECRHGNIELFMNGDWVKVDTFTMQDILSNEVSYVHDGSETKSDRCIIFVSNDQGEQRNAFYINLYLFFTSTIYIIHHNWHKYRNIRGKLR